MDICYWWVGVTGGEWGIFWVVKGTWTFFHGWIGVSWVGRCMFWQVGSGWDIFWEPGRGQV